MTAPEGPEPRQDPPRLDPPRQDGERRGSGTAAPASPAEMRAYIVERLVGDTGEPVKVLAAARSLAERAQPLFTAALNGFLAVKLSVEVKGVELARTTEAKALGEAGQLVVVAPGGGASDTAFMALDADALALVVCAMFGGDPGLGLAPIARDPSAIEVEVAATLFAALAEALNEGGALGLELPLPEIKTGGEARKFAPRDGPAARITLRLAAGGHGGDVTLIVLQRILLGRRGATLAANAPQGAGSTGAGGGIGGEVMRSAISVEATMPLARTTLGAVSGFAVGQVVAFDDGALAQARLLVRGKPIFSGEFGRLGASYTVRVREPFSEAKDFMDTLLPG